MNVKQQNQSSTNVRCTIPEGYWESTLIFRMSENCVPDRKLCKAETWWWNKSDWEHMEMKCVFLFCLCNAILFCLCNAVLFCLCNAVLFCLCNAVLFCLCNAILFCLCNAFLFCLCNAFLFCLCNAILFCLCNAILFM